MARDLKEFWRNLREGRDCITEIPKEKWDYKVRKNFGVPWLPCANKDNDRYFYVDFGAMPSSISQKTLDEAPDAYKNIHEVMQAQKTSVKPLKQLLPIINWKG